MIDIEIAISQFFDRRSVLESMDKATYKVFNDFGRAVRATAMKSLKYSDDVSRPGSQPHAHRSRQMKRKSKKTGKTKSRSVSFLREFLYYSWDNEAQSVVIGPVKLGSTIDADALPALEYGGSSNVMHDGAKERVSIAARPFMRPAADAELHTLPDMWKDSIR